MNKRRLFPSLSLVLMSSTLLVACQIKNDDKAKDSSTKASRTSKSSSSSKAEQSSASSSQASSSGQALNEPAAVWSSSKASQLKDYILKEWGPALGQTYKDYGPNQEVNYYGLSLPTALLNPNSNQTMTADFAGLSMVYHWRTCQRASCFNRNIFRR